MNIITSKTRARVRRDPKYHIAAKIEQKSFLNDRGIDRAVPLKGQTEEQSFEELKANASEIQESMAEKAESKRKRDAAKSKERLAQQVKTAEKRYMANREENDHKRKELAQRMKQNQS